MPLTIVQISARLRNILAELDRRNLHLPAIHVAKAIEVIEISEDKPVVYEPVFTELIENGVQKLMN